MVKFAKIEPRTLSAVVIEKVTFVHEGPQYSTPFRREVILAKIDEGFLVGEHYSTATENRGYKVTKTFTKLSKAKEYFQVLRVRDYDEVSLPD